MVRRVFIPIALAVLLTGCASPARHETAIVRNKAGRIQRVYGYYLDPHGNRILDGEDYIYTGDGATPGGWGHGIRRKYENGKLVGDERFTVTP